MKIGDKAPEFALKDRTGKVYSLKNFKSDYLVVYFYPKDDTPGCTIEAQEFTKGLPKLSKLKTEVIGISGGDEKSKASFCKKYNLKVLLLSDPTFKVSKSWGSYGDKVFMGRKFKGIFRNTYLLDKNRKIAWIFDKVNPEGHLAEIYATIAKLSKKSAPTKAAQLKSTISLKPTAAKKSLKKKVVAAKAKAPAKRLTLKSSLLKKAELKKGATKKVAPKFVASKKAAIKKTAPKKGLIRKTAARSAKR